MKEDRGKGERGRKKEYSFNNTIATTCYHGNPYLIIKFQYIIILEERLHNWSNITQSINIIQLTSSCHYKPH